MEWAVYRTIPFDVYVLKQLWILHDFLGNFCNLDWLMTVVFFFFFSARGFTRDAKVRWSALTKEWCWSCCDSWRKRYDAHTSVTGPGLHVSIIYQNRDVRMLYCRVSVRLLLGLLGQFTLVTYPRRTGGKRPHFVPWTTWPETHWPRGKVPYWSFWVWAED